MNLTANLPIACLGENLRPPYGGRTFFTGLILPVYGAPLDTPKIKMFGQFFQCTLRRQAPKICKIIGWYYR